MVIIIYEVSPTLRSVVMCPVCNTLLVYIFLLCLQYGKQFAREFSGYLDDGCLRLHPLAVVNVAIRQFPVVPDGNPACLYNQWAYLMVASECLHSTGSLLSTVMTSGNQA